jgi:hypothetical protein
MRRPCFFDDQGRLLAYVVGDAVFGPIRTVNGAQTTALKVGATVVARAEDVDGLRWVVDTGKVKIVDANLVRRVSLGDNGRQFVASTIKIIDTGWNELYD